MSGDRDSPRDAVGVGGFHAAQELFEQLTDAQESLRLGPEGNSPIRWFAEVIDDEDDMSAGLRSAAFLVAIELNGSATLHIFVLNSLGVASTALCTNFWDSHHDADTIPNTEGLSRLTSSAHVKDARRIAVHALEHLSTTVEGCLAAESVLGVLSQLNIGECRGAGTNDAFIMALLSRLETLEESED